MNQHIQLALSVDEASMHKMAGWKHRLNYKFGFVYSRKIGPNHFLRKPEPEKRETPRLIQQNHDNLTQNVVFGDENSTQNTGKQNSEVGGQSPERASSSGARPKRIERASVTPSSSHLSQTKVEKQPNQRERKKPRETIKPKNR